MFFIFFHLVVKHFICTQALVTFRFLLLMEQIYLIGWPFPLQHFLYISSLEHVLHPGQHFLVLCTSDSEHFKTWFSSLFIFFYNFKGQSFLWGYWYPCFGLLMTSPLEFQSQSGQPYSHLMTSWWFLMTSTLEFKARHLKIWQKNYVCWNLLQNKVMIRFYVWDIRSPACLIACVQWIPQIHL